MVPNDQNEGGCFWGLLLGLGVRKGRKTDGVHGESTGVGALRAVATQKPLWKIFDILETVLFNLSPRLQKDSPPPKHTQACTQHTFVEA